MAAAGFDRQASLIRQLQGMLGGRRFVDGTVGSTGTVVTGDGWSVVRNSVGDYTITFLTPFAQSPHFQTTPVGSTVIVRIESRTASAVNVRSLSLANVLTDATFDFLATGK